MDRVSQNNENDCLENGEHPATETSKDDLVNGKKYYRKVAHR